MHADVRVEGRLGITSFRLSVQRLGEQEAEPAVLGGGAEFVRRNVVKGISRSLKRQNQTRLATHVGAAIGSLLTYAGVRAIGLLARNYYRPGGAVTRVRALARR